MRSCVPLAACTLMVGLLHTSMPLGAQRIERSAILPAGGGSVIGVAHIAWSSGQVAVTRLGSGALTITQGFQQPYFPIANIRTESFSGKPGEVGQMKIIFDDPIVLSAVTAHSLLVKLKFNATLLQPIRSSAATEVLADTIVDGARLMTLRMPIVSTGLPSQVLSTLDFSIGLGNDSACALELAEVIPLGGVIRMRRTNGNFTLLGICREGGIRLVNPVDRSRLLLRPNPIRDNGTLEFDIHERGIVQASIVDLFGHTLTTVVNDDLRPGHYVVTFSTRGLPAGAHTVVLKTPSATTSRPVVIQH